MGGKGLGDCFCGVGIAITFIFVELSVRSSVGTVAFAFVALLWFTELAAGVQRAQVLLEFLVMKSGWCLRRASHGEH